MLWHFSLIIQAVGLRNPTFSICFEQEGFQTFACCTWAIVHHIEEVSSFWKKMLVNQAYPNMLLLVNSGFLFASRAAGDRVAAEVPRGPQRSKQ